MAKKEKIYFWKNRKIQFDILTGFVLILVLTYTSLVYYTYNRITSLFIDSSYKIINEMGKTALANATEFIIQSKKISIITANLFHDLNEINMQNEDVINYMLSVLRTWPQLNAMYAGGKNGNFLMVARILERTNYVTQAKLIPVAAKYFIRYIDQTHGQPSELWEYLNDDGDLIDHEINYSVQYDPRLRPWYMQVREDEIFNWSEIYQFSTNKSVGMTAAYPILGKNSQLLGVVGVDVIMGSISDFLEKSKVGNDGVTFIVNEQGMVISFPKKTPYKLVKGDDVSLFSLDQLKDKALLTAFQIYKSSPGDDQFIFQYGGDDYIAGFARFSEDFGKDWIVSIVVPLNSFMGVIKETKFHTLLIYILIFILGVIISIVWSKQLSKPIVMMTEEADNIRRFKTDGAMHIISNIREIRGLSESLVAMRNSMQSFAKFVPKSVVAKLLHKGSEVKIGGKNRFITLLFSDIEGFTSVAENYPNDKLMDHLSEYFDELTKIITDNQGSIDKYIGDSIMAFWGAPIPDKAHAFHACVAALMCQKKLQELNRKWLSESKPILNTRIGLHTGEAIVGNMGSTDRLNYTAIGDAVNVASRLEGVNKIYETKIIISQATYELVEKIALVRPLDIVVLKGKEKSEKIYELVALKAANTRIESSLLPAENQVQFCNIFTKALDNFLERRWEEAAEQFRDALTYNEIDKTTQIYIERCDHYMKNPPSKDWDGIEKLLTK